MLGISHRPRAIEDLKDGAIDVTDAFGKYNAEADAAVKANEQYQKAAEKMANHTQVAADEIDVLAEYLGNMIPMFFCKTGTWSGL